MSLIIDLLYCGKVPQLGMNMSRSLRVSEALFESATAAGVVLSRSAAQQVEHWARLGRALEAAGLTVEAAASLPTKGVGEKEALLWDGKRKRQRMDIENIETGRTRQADAYLFTAAVARDAKVLNGPY